MAPAMSLTFTALMYLAGIPLQNNVTGLAKIDLDVRNVRLALDVPTTPNFQAASTAYFTGSGVAFEIEDGTTTMLTLQTIFEDFTGEFYFDMYSSYYGSKTYANNLIVQALNNNGTFAGKNVLVREEGVHDGIIALIFWMKIVTELEEARLDCSPGAVADSFDVEAAWAFYTGSLQVGVTSPGELLYAMANEFCQYFGTCGALGTATVNGRMTALIAEGQSLERFGLCDQLIESKQEVAAQLDVILVQGLLYHAYFASPNLNQMDMLSFWGEAYIFAAALLPQVNYCNATAANIIKNNVNINQPSPLQSGGFLAVYNAIRSVYPCLNITCADVGALAVASLAVCTDPTSAAVTILSPTTTSVTFAPTSTTSNSSSTGGIVALAIFLVAAYCFSVCAAFRYAKRSAYEQMQEGIASKNEEMSKVNRVIETI
jgi:hypothetical protein